MTVSPLTASTTLPRPEPRTTPTCGCSLVFVRMYPTASLIACIMGRRVYACAGSTHQKERDVERFSALIGFVVILAIAYLLSNNRKAIRWRTVFWGLLLQIIIAIAVLKGKEIAAALSAIAIPIDRSIAAIIFIALAIIIYQIAI